MSAVLSDSLAELLHIREYCKLVGEDRSYEGIIQLSTVEAAIAALSSSAQLLENHLPVHIHCIKDFEQIGKRCLDTGACHHSCTKTCFRKDGCVPLSIAETFLNDDWTIKTPDAALTTTPESN